MTHTCCEHVSGMDGPNLILRCCECQAERTQESDGASARIREELERMVPRPRLDVRT